MSLHFDGLLIGLFTFLVIGLFHPVVIKTEYYFGTRPWWLFLVAGAVALVLAILAESIMAQALLGVFAFSSFWAIKELFEQQERVDKGWFPRNPKRGRKDTNTKQ